MKRGRREARLFPTLGRNSVDNNVAEAQGNYGPGILQFTWTQRKLSEPPLAKKTSKTLKEIHEYYYT